MLSSPASQLQTRSPSREDVCSWTPVSLSCSWRLRSSPSRGSPVPRVGLRHHALISQSSSSKLPCAPDSSRRRSDKAIHSVVKELVRFLGFPCSRQLAVPPIGDFKAKASPRSPFILFPKPHLEPTGKKIFICQRGEVISSHAVLAMGCGHQRRPGLT